MAISKTNVRNTKKQSDTSHTVFETAPKAVLLMLLTGLFILLISTIFILNLPSPIDFSRPIALMSLFIGAAAGGFFCSKQIEAPNAFAAAALASVILVILLIIAKTLIPTTVGGNNLTFSIIGYIASMASAMTGALFGSKTKRRKRRKKTYRS